MLRLQFLGRLTLLMHGKNPVAPLLSEIGSFILQADRVYKVKHYQRLMRFYTASALTKPCLKNVQGTRLRVLHAKYSK